MESGFRPDAIGDDGRSIGMMQMLASTAADFGAGRADLLDPERAVAAAMSYLRWAWDYLDARLARPPTWSEWIGSYNAGVGNVGGGLFIPQSYVRKVLAARQRWGG